MRTPSVSQIIYFIISENTFYLFPLVHRVELEVGFEQVILFFLKQSQIKVS